jgi:hypothetical protein
MNTYSTSPHVIIASSDSSTYVGTNPSNPLQGMLRLNGSNMEAFDGSYWKHVGNSVGVGLSDIADSAINWAIKRMKEERAWAELAETNEAVKIALDNLEEARRQLSITATLAREHDTETTS